MRKQVQALQIARSRIRRIINRFKGRSITHVKVPPLKVGNRLAFRSVQSGDGLLIQRE